MQRKVRKMVRGQHTVDGAGVRLVRVLGYDTVRDFDPFLMLDSFDSTNPEDYIAGFPWHPHRGIETITYLISGEIDHEDSLGNKGRITAGQSQWMTAGSGILHQEMPQPAERMLGFQLWLNLPQREKMTDPQYFDITEELVGKTETESADIRVISGEFRGVQGAKPHHIAATILDVTLRAGEMIAIDTKPEETVFVFLIEGDALVAGERVAEKTAVLYEDGDCIEVSAPKEAASRFIFYSGKPLGEGIAWGGPIVMNTREELNQAFEDLDNGTFIKHEAKF